MFVPMEGHCLVGTLSRKGRLHAIIVAPAEGGGYFVAGWSKEDLSGVGTFRGPTIPVYEHELPFAVSQSSTADWSSVRVAWRSVRCPPIALNGWVAGWNHSEPDIFSAEEFGVH
jgi:hypothetical protein